MEIKNIWNNKLNRKKFFASAGISAAGFFLLRTFPFIHKQKEIIVQVKLNSQSVSRTKIGDKNV